MVNGLERVDPEHFDKFKPILTFHESSHLFDLIDKKIVATEPKYGWIAKLLASFYPTASVSKDNKIHKAGVKLLMKKFQLWNDFFVEQLLDNNDSLLKLKHLAHYIFTNKKTEWIRQKMRQIQVNSKKLNGALLRFEKNIIRILSKVESTQDVPKPEFVPLRPLDLSGYFYYSSFAALYGYNKTSDLFVKKIYLPMVTRIQEEKVMEHSRILELEQSFHHFCLYLPKTDPDWKLNLLVQFAALNDDDEIKLAASLLVDIQGLEIFNVAATHEEYQKKIPFLLIYLPFETLLSVLLGLDHLTIRKLQTSFEHHPCLKSKNYLDLFHALRQQFVNLCNESKSQIDELNADLRNKIERIDYLHSDGQLNYDLQRIDNLREEISMNREASNKFFTLIEDAFFDSTTTQLRFQMDNNYKNELDRCTEIPDEEMILKDSCPFGILHGRIFGDNNCSDDQGPLDIFAAWNLLYASDYQEVGLLPDITQEKFEEWLREPTKGNFYTAYNLHKIGINTIKDFKRHKIFNRTMLQNYIAQPQIKEQLRAPQHPLIDLFAEWGIIYLRDYQTIGLVRTISAEKYIEIHKNFELKTEFICAKLDEIGIAKPEHLKELGINSKAELCRFLARSSRDS